MGAGAVVHRLRAGAFVFAWPAWPWPLHFHFGRTPGTLSAWHLQASSKPNLLLSPPPASHCHFSHQALKNHTSLSLSLSLSVSFPFSHFGLICFLFLFFFSPNKENERVLSSMYSTQWFITVFTYNMPFSIVLRMWDVFLYEGYHAIFVFALALISIFASEIKKKSFEGLLRYWSKKQNAKSKKPKTKDKTNHSIRPYFVDHFFLFFFFFFCKFATLLRDAWSINWNINFYFVVRFLKFDPDEESEPFPNLNPEKLMRRYSKLFNAVVKKVGALSDKYVKMKEAEEREERERAERKGTPTSSSGSGSNNSANSNNGHYWQLKTKKKNKTQ